MPRVTKICWSSRGGLVEFRPVCEDGSVGSVETTSIETNDLQRFLREKERIERERIDREVPD